MQKFDRSYVDRDNGSVSAKDPSEPFFRYAQWRAVLYNLLVMVTSDKDFYGKVLLLPAVR